MLPEGRIPGDLQSRGGKRPLSSRSPLLERARTQRSIPDFWLPSSHEYLTVIICCAFIFFSFFLIYILPTKKKRIFLLKKEIFSCFYSEIRPKKYSIQLPVLILISIYPSVHVLVRIKALILDLFLFTDLFLFFFLPIIYNYNNFLNRNVHF